MEHGPSAPRRETGDFGVSNMPKAELQSRLVSQEVRRCPVITLTQKDDLLRWTFNIVLDIHLLIVPVNVAVDMCGQFCAVLGPGLDGRLVFIYRTFDRSGAS